MKKIFSLVLVTVSLLVTSCTSEDNELLTENNSITLELESQKKVEKVINSKKSDQRISYKLLDYREKYNIWINRLNDLSMNNSFSSEQLELIEEIRENIKPSSFKKENLNQFKYITLKEWLKKARKSFTKLEMKYAFSNINKYPTSEELKSIIKSNKQDVRSRAELTEDSYDPLDCSCNIQDDYCVFSDCNSEWDCNSDDSGCGTFWMEDCNGEC